MVKKKKFTVVILYPDTLTSPREEGSTYIAMVLADDALDAMIVGVEEAWRAHGARGWRPLVVVAGHRAPLAYGWQSRRRHEKEATR